VKNTLDLATLVDPERCIDEARVVATLPIRRVIRQRDRVPLVRGPVAQHHFEPRNVFHEVVSTEILSALVRQLEELVIDRDSDAAQQVLEPESHSSRIDRREDIDANSACRPGLQADAGIRVCRVKLPSECVLEVGFAVEDRPHRSHAAHQGAGSLPPVRRSGSPGWTSPCTPPTAKGRPGGYPGRDPRCCAGRSMKPAKPTPAPRLPTTATTPPSPTARTPNAPPCPKPARSSGRLATS